MAKRSPFDGDARFTRHRTWRAARVPLLVALVSAVALALVMTFMPALVEVAAQEAEGASSTRRATQARFGPAALWLICAVLLLASLWQAFNSFEWRHAESGHRLRRAMREEFEGGDAKVVELHQRFLSGDPAVYTPTPERAYVRKYADVALEIWDVPEDAVAYIAIATGKGRTTRHAGLLRYEGAHYRALLAAVADSKLRKPLPDAANPLLAGGAR